jgi:hypothetical protein
MLTPTKSGEKDAKTKDTQGSTKEVQGNRKKEGRTQQSE